MKILPPFVDKMLTMPPRAGEGVHNWLFRVARQLHAHLPAGEIVNLLESRVVNCGRAVSRAEIISAVQNSLPCAWQPNGNAAPVQSAAKWPEVNQEQREAIVRDGGGLADFWNYPARALRTTGNTRKKSLTGFSPAIRFCAAASRVRNLTPARVKIGAGNCPRWQLIVPSPMSAPSQA